MARFTGGWIKLHRDLAEKDIAQNPFLFSLWVYLHLIANYKESQIIWKGEQKILLPGQCLIKLREMSNKWHCSPTTIWKWLHYLVKSERITIESRTHGTLVTICNWTESQVSELEERTRSEHEVNTKRTRSEHEVNYMEEVPSVLKKERIQEEKKTHTLHPIAILWNEIVKPPLSKVIRTEGTRLKTCEKQYEDHPEPEYWRGLITKVDVSSFLRGDQGKWKASFDWILKPINATKVLEGNYDNREQLANGKSHNNPFLDALMEGDDNGPRLEN